jgi:hypothetical protein
MRQQQSVRDCGRWQFTLREMLIGTALVAAVLGFGSWQGPLGAAGVLAVAGLCLLGMAFFSRRQRLAVFSGICLLLSAVDAGLFFFGPRSETGMICSTCGRGKGIAVFLGITWREREYETRLSEWYHLAGLRSHQHRWVLVSSSHQRWGGGWGHNTYTIGGEFVELWLLRKAWDKADQPTFHDLVEDYYATRKDPSKTPAFCEKCTRLGVGLGYP